ncbi:hypothetical protein ASPWEDRAFT_167491 [Aspergillus wentii DTO 134E9]|uniref:Dickkopf N-terminal cysteine-rich domain-containing protein n=1 Tax=Aspergillus wentii DTO 134E9 TaxID=1073089 RepID=A0A1L9S2U7_ASPWE|nr:uncharacterized protein ASPWEDRAFT_167491 [Aspergillus wentii DTO 134E9]KAI9929824.1 hypothetical protein MW887_011629 [Aspergillus wentii]OJJ41476.1 hypothetical protein ASPWEDRAFT_167491 [Aspergillus wentii DTO 134E9]
MKLSFVATFALLGLAAALPASNNDAATNKLKAGDTCKPDGSLGICESNKCIKDKDADTGNCQ